MSRLWVVRPEPRPSGLVRENVEYEQIRGRVRIFQLIKALWVTAKLVRLPSIAGVLNFNAVPYGLIAVVAGKLAGKPVHVGFVGSEAFNLSHPRSSRFLGAILKRANLFTVPGRGIAELLVARGHEPSLIFDLPHAVDLDRWSPPSEESRSIDLLFVGRLDANKQVDKILESVAAIREIHPAITVAVVGEGAERSRLEVLVDRLNLQDNVNFVGYQPDPLPWFHAARFLIIASLREGFPFVIVEAMCTGVVPIAARVGEIPDVVVHGETGYLFDNRDPRGLERALRRVFDDPEAEELMRRRVLAYRSHFSYERAAHLWAEWLADWD